MVRRMLYWAGGEVVGAEQGKTFLPPHSAAQVLQAHTKQEHNFFDLGSKAMYNSGWRVVGGSTAFEDPSTWPLAKVLLLFIISSSY